MRHSLSQRAKGSWYARRLHPSRASSPIPLHFWLSLAGCEKALPLRGSDSCLGRDALQQARQLQELASEQLELQKGQLAMLRQQRSAWDQERARLTQKMERYKLKLTELYDRCAPCAHFSSPSLVLLFFRWGPKREGDLLILADGSEHLGIGCGCDRWKDAQRGGQHGGGGNAYSVGGGSTPASPFAGYDDSIMDYVRLLILVRSCGDCTLLREYGRTLSCH